MNITTILQGHVLDQLKTLPENHVNCCVTSPPYWGLRAYGTEPQVWSDGWTGELGGEPTIQCYIAHMVEIFEEVKRVLRDDGVLWCNIMGGYQNKQMDLVPQRLVIALSDAGWYVRCDCIWHKPNPLPESVRDRPSKAHEYVFMLTKKGKYWYDAEAVRQPNSPNTHSHGVPNKPTTKRELMRFLKPDVKPGHYHKYEANGANLNSVWTLPTHAFPDAHFATFPPKLCEIPILASCPAKCCPHCGAGWVRVVKKGEKYPIRGYEADAITSRKERRFVRDKGWTAKSGYGNMQYEYNTVDWQPSCQCPHVVGETVPGLVLDPFLGSGTTALVANRLGRNAIGVELNAEYVAMAEKRIVDDQPLLNRVINPRDPPHNFR